MTSQPEDVLRSVFGFQSFRPGQRAVVEHLLQGENLLAVMPTGAGKSLCYQVPALMFARPTVVVSPLVALMDDQVAGLRANGVDVAVVHSGRSRDENVADWRRFQKGEAKILYLSPERLMTGRMIEALKPLDPAMFVVDEAHCISKWGVSFRPEYEALSLLKKRHFPGARMAAFTATADPATRRDIADKLFDGDGHIIVRGFDRPNISLGVSVKSQWRRQLMSFLSTRRDASGIVYCLSRKLVESVSDFLREEGVKALPYHAGLSPEVRKENQETFMAESGVVMVATIAFGMGIDKPDIRYVFHLNLPSSMEAYYQEIGRAGRDGAAADVEMLYGLDDMRARRQFIDQDAGDEDHKRREHKRLDALLAFCETTSCRRAAMLEYFGEEAQPCGNCDICLNPPTLVDASDEAKTLFGVIAATGERFGMAHIIDVLRGAQTERIRSLRHDNLPQHGLGRSRAKKYWQAFIRQALGAGYLALDIEGFGGLQLRAKGRQVLAGSEPFMLRADSAKADKPSAKAKKRQAEADVDADLLSRLKTLRRELAEVRQVPAYIIFSDATLIDMCHMRPENLEQMALVSGVGPKKLEDFGQAFLEVLQ